MHKVALKIIWKVDIAEYINLIISWCICMCLLYCQYICSYHSLLGTLESSLCAVGTWLHVQSYLHLYVPVVPSIHVQSYLLLCTPVCACGTVVTCAVVLAWYFPPLTLLVCFSLVYTASTCSQLQYWILNWFIINSIYWNSTQGIGQDMHF